MKWFCIFSTRLASFLLRPLVVCARLNYKWTRDAWRRKSWPLHPQEPHHASAENDFHPSRIIYSCSATDVILTTFAELWTQIYLAVLIPNYRMAEIYSMSRRQLFATIGICCHWKFAQNIRTNTIGLRLCIGEHDFIRNQRPVVSPQNVFFPLDFRELNFRGQTNMSGTKTNAKDATIVSHFACEAEEMSWLVMHSDVNLSILK